MFNKTLKNHPVQVVCMLDDLKQIFNEWRAEQQKKEQQQQDKKEAYLSTEMVCDLLQVTKPTLWRWQKLNYLVPVKVGRKNFYKQSDIDALRK